MKGTPGRDGACLFLRELRVSFCRRLICWQVNLDLTAAEAFPVPQAFRASADREVALGCPANQVKLAAPLFLFTADITPIQACPVLLEPPATMANSVLQASLAQ